MPSRQKPWQHFVDSATDSFSPQWGEGPRMRGGYTQRSQFPPFARQNPENPRNNTFITMKQHLPPETMAAFRGLRHRFLLSSMGRRTKDEGWLYPALPVSTVCPQNPENPRNITFITMKQQPSRQKPWQHFAASATDSFSPQWGEGPRMRGGYTQRSQFPPFARKTPKIPEISLFTCRGHLSSAPFIHVYSWLKPPPLFPCRINPGYVNY